MNILAIVLARGGSKRLPGKNIRLLGDKPLIAWSIDAARSVAEIGAILVSTDDPAIAAVCADGGALVPWLRPAELASDTATSVDAVLHALDWYEVQHGAVDGVLLLQPTSPFRSAATLRRGIGLFDAKGRRPVVGVSPCASHPMWTMKLAGDYLAPFLPAQAQVSRAQDLPPAYAINGAFYLIAPSDLRAGRSFVGDRTVPLIIDSPREALDIDTAWDWTVAEAVLAQDDGAE
jgi:CMP-N,N'-diacetyllegionaminic acid synthase